MCLQKMIKDGVIENAVDYENIVPHCGLYTVISYLWGQCSWINYQNSVDSCRQYFMCKWFVAFFLQKTIHYFIMHSWGHR